MTSRLRPLTPTVVRPRFLTARSYHERNRIISLLKASRNCSVLLRLAFSAGRFTGQAHAALMSSEAGASSGKSSSIGPLDASKSFKAASSTFVWNEASLGTPRGRPNSKETHRARGGLMISVCSRMRLICVVGTPSSSKKWASAPTARVQNGQTGTSRIASTRSFLRRLTRSRAVGSMSLGSVAPIKE